MNNTLPPLCAAFAIASLNWSKPWVVATGAEIVLALGVDFRHIDYFAPFLSAAREMISATSLGCETICKEVRATDVPVSIRYLHSLKL